MGSAHSVQDAPAYALGARLRKTSMLVGTWELSASSLLALPPLATGACCALSASAPEAFSWPVPLERLSRRSLSTHGW